MEAVQKFVSQETVSARDYLRLTRETPGVIRSCRFVPPKMGRRGDFGSFWVEYHRPQRRLYPIKGEGAAFYRSIIEALSPSGDGARGEIPPSGGAAGDFPISDGAGRRGAR